MAIKQKPSGGYEVDVRDKDDIRIRRSFKNKSDAKAFEGKIYREKYESRLEKNKLRKSRYKVSQALQDFLAIKSELRQSSIKKYSYFTSQLKIFSESMSIVFVDEFSPDHATLFYNELVREKIDPTGNTKKLVKPKPKTVNFFLQSARSFFSQEVMKEHTRRNPFLHIKSLKVDKPKPDFYTLQELKAFFSQDIPESYRMVFLGLLYTGMRFGELANLTWEDIDFDKRFIYVRSKDNFKTKTHNSERAIPLIDDLYEILIQEFENKKSEKFVFCSPKGKQLSERRTLEVCKKVAEDAGITSRAYLHKFRHTYATLLIQRGAPIESIKELLGHWSVVQTEAYAHNSTDHLLPQVSRLNKLLTK